MVVACRGKTVEGLAFLRCHGQLIIQGKATVVPSLLMGHHLSREEARRGKVVAVVHAGVRLCGAWGGKVHLDRAPALRCPQLMVTYSYRGRPLSYHPCWWDETYEGGGGGEHSQLASLSLCHTLHTCSSPSLSLSPLPHSLTTTVSTYDRQVQGSVEKKV